MQVVMIKCYLLNREKNFALIRAIVFKKYANTAYFRHTPIPEK